MATPGLSPSPIPKWEPKTIQQPDYFEAFHCINSACEDTCCTGWVVHVDKATYNKYQGCSSWALGSSLKTLITINEKSKHDDDYAIIKADAAGCHFLSEGLCSIQIHLGEDYLPNMCATYPRVMNSVDEVLQRSLDLSCPEAARVVLLNPKPIEFREQKYTEGSIRLGVHPGLDTSGLTDASQPYPFFREVKLVVISVLQNRSLPVWKRLFALGCLTEELDEMIAVHGASQYVLSRLELYASNLASGLVDDLLLKCPAQPAVQLEVALELIIARISSESSPRRFLECYQEFMQGLQWTSQSTAEELAARYREAYSQEYSALMGQNEHVLEHYLVNYAYRTLFPFGLPASNLRLRNDRVASPIAAQYMLLVAYFAAAKAVLIGMAAFHQSAFDVGRVLKLIQSASKTFEHSLTYPGEVIEMLAEKNMTSPATLCVLIRN